MTNQSNDTVNTVAKNDQLQLNHYVPEVDPAYVPWGCYKLVNTVIKSRRFGPVWISGDSGNGKTLGVSQACAQLNRELIIVNITNETAEEDLIGMYSLVDGEKGPVTKWQDGPVLTAMRRGAILCLDEIDQATPRILCLQTILQNSTYINKKTNEIIKPAPGFNVIATANTKGSGNKADRFIGAQLMNEAFLERFNMLIDQPYPDADIESKIMFAFAKKLGFDIPKQTVYRITKLAGHTRAAFSNEVIGACITTRRVCQFITNLSILDVDCEKDALELTLNRFNASDRAAMLLAYDGLVK